MDEEITIIDQNTRNEKIKNFFVKNKKKIIIIISILILILIGYFSIDEIRKRNKIKLANLYNYAVIDYNLNNKEKIIYQLTDLINKKDKTYSPLALYFIIDNNLISNQDDINDLFNVLIDKTKLEVEIKNLIIYKKALYNSDFVDENELIKILNPIINTESIWKSHSLYLLAEYFYSRNQKIKSKEFFEKILSLSNANIDIKQLAQKKLNRDFRE